MTVPVAPPVLALIILVPTSSALMVLPVVTAATVVTDEFHTALVVRSCVLPSVYVPVAVNIWVRPLAILSRAGATPMLLSAAAVTVSVVLPVIPLTAAVMLAVPIPVAVASPALTVATAVDCELQVAVVVKFCLVPSE